MHNRFPKLLMVCASALLLAACAGDSKKDDMSGSDQSSMASDGSTSTAGTGTAAGFQGDALDDPSSVLYTRVVYFDLDRSDIRPDQRDIVEAHARYLSNNPGATVLLEGHTDERGSREYNVALGERRADSVRNLMSLMGASGTQLRSISYGEERPAVMGHDEEAWAMNRRVEIVYQTR
jgi:peptidoglycan-associated lipoprotein